MFCPAIGRVRNKIAFRSSSSASDTAGDLTVDVPSGVQDGDVLVAHVTVRRDDSDLPEVATPSGWTLVRSVSRSGGGISQILNVYVRVASGEPASYTFDITTDEDGSAGSIQAFTGVDTHDPVDVENGQDVGDPGASRQYSTPSITTTTTNTMLVAAVSQTSSYTWTPPSGMTESWDDASLAPVNAAGQGGAGAYGLQAAAGATGAKTFTASSNLDANETSCTHILALRPG